ncbi:helix-turn-helix domain-containing protein [Larkinella bovis]|uniref:Helix-turn-helix domain-containing protein n=1 Tax=Larkinella bovis TaxID=683041 RepID=A0ABW0I6I0_9BACT
MSNTPEEIGQLIRITRKKKQLTQKELGAKMGVSESAVNKLESGTRSLTVQTLKKVTEALGVKLCILFEEA